MDDLKVELIEYLEEAARQVRILEEEANEALHTDKDEAAYRLKMSEKAELLGSLAGDAEPLLMDLPSTESKGILERLERFSESADNALDVDSVFYMSALLYPEDYQEGDKNDLELFIEKIKGR